MSSLPPDGAGAPPAHSDSPYCRGAWKAMPLLIGVVLFGGATGAATAQSGVPDGLLFALPALVYAGVGQLAYAQLFALGAPFVSILATLVLINLRYLIYATVASSWEKPRSRLMQAIGPYFITESAFAMALNEPRADRYRFLIGAGAVLWATWVVSCIVGALLSGALPPLKHGYAVPAIVLAPILMALIKGRQRIAVAAIALVLGFLLVALPYRLGPLFAGSGAALLVVLAGLLMGRRR